MSLKQDLTDKALKFFKVKAPQDNELLKYLGKTVRTMDGEVVLIQQICGSIFYPTRFEINGEHHVVILDFYRQMNKDRSITDEMVKEFDEMVHEVEAPPQPKSMIDNLKKVRS